MTDKLYTSSHEWVSLDEDGTATIGISDFAQEALGDIVFVELPDSGSVVSAGQEIAVVESVKAASDIYSPVSGEVVEVNDALEAAPDTINTDPEEKGWLYRIKLQDAKELENLMDSEKYQESCA